VTSSWSRILQLCFYFNILITHEVTIRNTVETVNLLPMSAITHTTDTLYQHCTTRGDENRTVCGDTNNAWDENTFPFYITGYTFL